MKMGNMNNMMRVVSYMTESRLVSSAQEIIALCKGDTDMDEAMKTEVFKLMDKTIDAETKRIGELNALMAKYGKSEFIPAAKEEEEEEEEGYY